MWKLLFRTAPHILRLPLQDQAGRRASVLRRTPAPTRPKPVAVAVAGRGCGDRRASRHRCRAEVYPGGGERPSDGGGGHTNDPQAHAAVLRTTYAEPALAQQLDRGSAGIRRGDPARSHIVSAFTGVANTFLLLREDAMMPDSEAYLSALQSRWHPPRPDHNARSRLSTSGGAGVAVRRVANSIGHSQPMEITPRRCARSPLRGRSTRRRPPSPPTTA